MFQWCFSLVETLVNECSFLDAVRKEKPLSTAAFGMHFPSKPLLQLHVGGCCSKTPVRQKHRSVLSSWGIRVQRNKLYQYVKGLNQTFCCDKPGPSCHSISYGATTKPWRDWKCLVCASVARDCDFKWSGYELLDFIYTECKAEQRFGITPLI